MIFRLFQTSHSKQFDVDHSASLEVNDPHQHLFENRPDGQITFNKQIIARDHPKPSNDVVSGPWMSNRAVTSLPNHRHDFLKSTDPVRLKEVEAANLSETQRREETETPQFKGSTQSEHALKKERGSKMIAQDQPQANLKPPLEISAAVDHETFNRLWLAEQRDAAMKNNTQVERSEPDYAPLTPRYAGPER